MFERPRFSCLSSGLSERIQRFTIIILFFSTFNKFGTNTFNIQTFNYFRQVTLSNFGVVENSC